MREGRRKGLRSLEDEGIIAGGDEGAVSGQDEDADEGLTGLPLGDLLGRDLNALYLGQLVEFQFETTSGLRDRKTSFKRALHHHAVLLLVSRTLQLGVLEAKLCFRFVKHIVRFA